MKELDHAGYRFDEIAVSTFTKAMAAEFEERAREEFPVANDFDWFSTAHSLAFKLLRRNGHEFEEVVNTGKKAEFCKQHNYPFSWEVASDKSSTEDEKIGNALFQMREYSINMLQDPVDDWKQSYREVSPDPSISKKSVQRFNKEYEAWKQENNFIDFIDMIKICVDENYTLPVSVLIEDEFQDKSLLELKLFEVWSNNVERTFVAGDPFQAIYDFRGTKPEYMIEAYRQADESVILDNTYRFGEELWDFASNTLRSRGYNIPEISCSGDTEVEFLSWTQYRKKVNDYQTEDCFHLVRSRHMYDDVSKVLKSNSVIPRFDFDDDSNVPFEQYYNTVLNAISLANKVRGSIEGFGDKEIEPDDVELLVKMAPTSIFSKDKEKILKTVETKTKTGTPFLLADIFDRSGFVELFTSDNPFEKLTEERYNKWYQHRSTLAAAFENDQDLSKHISHDIGTLHASKGKESDYVFLLNATTSTIARGADERTEARVFFVGATRAEKKLFVVDTNEKHKFRLRGGS